MISHLLFGILIGIYYLLKLLFRVVFRRSVSPFRYMQAAGNSLETMASHFGGNVHRFHRRRVVLQMSDDSLMDLRYYNGHGKISIRIPVPFARPSITFQRLPRFLHAFVESFVSIEASVGKFPYWITSVNSHLLTDLKSQGRFFELFSQVAKLGYSVHMDEKGLRAWKRLPYQQLTDIELRSQYLLLREFARLVAAYTPVAVHEIPAIERCAYCHELAETELTRCSHCGTPHHQDCFDLNGKCSVYGCSSLQVERRQEVTQLAT